MGIGGLNWTKVGLKVPERDAALVEDRLRLNWTKVGLKGRIRDVDPI